MYFFSNFRSPSLNFLISSQGVGVVCLVPCVEVVDGSVASGGDRPLTGPREHKRSALQGSDTNTHIDMAIVYLLWTIDTYIEVAMPFYYITSLYVYVVYNV